MFPKMHDFDVDDYDISASDFLPGMHMGMLGVQERTFMRLLIKEGEADRLREFTSYFDEKPSNVSQTEIDEYWAKVKVRQPNGPCDKYTGTRSTKTFGLKSST